MFLPVLGDCRSVIWCICFLEISDEHMLTVVNKYEGRNFNSGNYLFTTDTK